MTAVLTQRSQPVALRRSIARQSGVIGAQIAAGIGNLGFSIAAVRALPGPHYAQFAAFLAGYLLINTPAASLMAGASLRPELTRRMRPIALSVGVALGLGLAVCSPWLAEVARLPVSLVLLLALDAPLAGVLALTRGQLFGQQQLAAAATGITAEPAVRCAVGLALLPLLGVTGAAIAVVAGGYLAYLVCVLLGRQFPPLASGGSGPAAPSTVFSFLLLAAVGAQDVIIANRVLAPHDAGVFAAASTLGGAVLFATSTIPLVVLAQLRDRQRHALGVALGVTFLGSAAATAALVAVPGGWLEAVLGPVGIRVHAVLPVYLAAMVLLCLARVLVASLCAAGRARTAVGAAALAAVVQVVLLLRASDVQDAALATLAAAAVLLVATGAASGLHAAAAARTAVGPPATVLPPPETGEGVPTAPIAGVEAARAVIDPRGRRRSRAGWRRADLTWVIGACLLGLAVRLATDRSVWIDEAISVHEASQPFGQMLHLLRSTDVHPPLYFSLLWGVIHLTGSTGELVVRIPSLVPGILLIAVAYGAAREFWDRRTARFAAVIAAIGPAAVWYSQDARMYALFMLFAAVAAWMLVRVLRRGRWIDLAWFTLGCAALLWTQYDTALPVATLFAILLGAAGYRAVRYRRWRLAAQAVSSAALVVVSFLPLVPWVLEQYRHTAGLSAAVPAQAGTGAATTPGVNAYSALANGVWALFGYHSDEVMVLINAFWPVLILLVLAGLGRGGSMPGRVLAAVAIVPPVVLFAVAQKRSDMFDLRYFAATVPMLNLLLARMVATWARGRFTRTVVPLLLIVALSAGLVDEQINRSNPRVYDFRSAVAYVKAKAQTGDLLLYGPSYLSAELQYYKPGIVTRPITGVPQTNARPRVFVLGSFLNKKEIAGQVGTAVSSLEHNRHLVRVVHFPNVTVWEFR